jgi:hypothetical protein
VVKDIFLMLGLACPPVTLLLGTLWIMALKRAQRAETMFDRVMLTQQLRGEIKDPNSRVMDALDSLAIEVERISEAQRFTARILADRHDAPRPSSLPNSLPSSVITPH